jgi:hypothetical protein
VSVATLLLELSRRNIRLETGGGRLHVDAPAGALTPELRAALTREKPDLLAALQAPRKVAFQTWETVLSDIAHRWDAHAREARSRGEEPRWLADESLTLEIREAIKHAIDAGSLAKAVEAIERWKAAWMVAIQP